jgi:predicted 3-demethylubiquinone-9 3-methyltransferase (glyoxalase superfamily)
MFTGQAREALELYADVFTGFSVKEIKVFGPGEAGAEGTVQRADAELNGHALIFIDSPPVHAFTFTPAMSLFVNYGEERDLVSAFEKLSAGGSIFMPINNYGFSRKFGWCADRFGVSWQLNLP